MVKKVKNSMGDADCRFGASVWEEVYVVCDECKEEFEDDDVLLYLYDGKWICEECLKNKFYSKSVIQILEDEKANDFFYGL